MDSLTVPFRPSPVPLVAGLGIGLLLVFAVLLALAYRVHAVPEPPIWDPVDAPPVACPGPGCERYPLSRAAPSLGRVLAARAAGLPPGGARPLPEAWDGVTGAEDRAFLAEVLEDVRRHVPTEDVRYDEEVDMLLQFAAVLIVMDRDGRPVPEGMPRGAELNALVDVARYHTLRDVAWAAFLAGERARVAAANDEKLRRHEAWVDEHAQLSADARRLRALDGSVLAFAALVAAGAAVRHARAPRSLRVDGHALSRGSVRLPWEEVASVTWGVQEVEVRLRGGRCVRWEGLELTVEAVAQLRRTTDRLLDAHGPPAEPPRALGALTSRAIDRE